MVTQMLNQLNRQGGGTGLVTACAAGGLGAAMIGDGIMENINNQSAFDLTISETGIALVTFDLR